MEASEAWKALFRDRIAEAHGHLNTIVWKIGNARGSLAGPVRAPATEATLARIELARRSLDDASSDIAAASVLMASAEELALRGGALAPWDPLPSVGHLPHHTADKQRRASRRLQEARLYAVTVYLAVEQCCVHVLGLRLLLDRPLLPGVDDLLDAERRNAFDLLNDLMVTANDCVSLVMSARKEVPGG
jgi:hypothetical protein